MTGAGGRGHRRSDGHVGGDRTAGSRQDDDAAQCCADGWIRSVPFTPAALAERLGLPVERCRDRAGATRSRRPDPARELSRRRNTHSAIAAFWRASIGMTLGRLRREIEPVTVRRLHALPVPLAALTPGHAIARRRRTVSGSAPASGLRNFRRRVGIRRCCRAACRITIPNGWTVCAWRAK